MTNWPRATAAQRDEVLKYLAGDPVGCRHVYRTLDPGYQHWDPQGDEPEPELLMLEGWPVLVSGMEARAADCLAWTAPTPAAIDAVAELASEAALYELTLLGDDAFPSLRPHLTDGAWRLSHNYGLTAETFRPCPSSVVRKLTPGDRAVVVKAQENTAALQKFLDGGYPQVYRDFDRMERGLPVLCYGAFASEDLVGFCSAAPICRGVQEIMLLVIGEGHRRQGLASGLVTVQIQEALAQGKLVGYHAGEATDDIHDMLLKLGFHPVKHTYRFIPSYAGEQWRTWWGKPV
jgi:hypothetical protein